MGAGITIFDSHSHYKSADAAALSGQDVLSIMDRENISHMVIVGEPPDRVQQLYRLAPERIIPFLGLYDSYHQKAHWILDPDLPGRLESYLKAGHYKGIGEIHLFKQNRENKNFRRVLWLADKHNLPVLFHGDAEVVDQIFKEFPGLKVIWAHLGTIPEPALLKRMLKRYGEKLYVDTSVRDLRIMGSEGITPKWKSFFVEHADQVMVGIDTFYTPRWKNINQVTSKIRTWLAELPEPVARKLAHENAMKLFGVDY